ncbi:phage virion morphogenesis protein, partial [Kingella kingae]
MIKISVESESLEHSLNQLLQNIQNRRPMMSSVAAELLSITEDNFESESWGGDKWKETH